MRVNLPLGYYLMSVEQLFRILFSLSLQGAQSADIESLLKLNQSQNSLSFKSKGTTLLKDSLFCNAQSNEISAHLEF